MTKSNHQINLEDKFTIDLSPFYDRIKGFSEEETKVFLETLHELKAGNTEAFESLYKADYREIPVGPREFLESDYYYGHVGKRMYPLWKKEFIKLYSSPDIYHVILTGGIGCGKDFFTETCLGYELYKLGCLRNPHDYYDRAESSNIVIALVSITKSQTKAVLFNDTKNMIDMSPWFQEKFQRNMDMNDTLEFSSPDDKVRGKIIVMYGAPNNSTIIGANVFIGVMDEANFMQVIQKSRKVRGLNKEYDQAKGLYNNMIRRIKSRYQKGGKIPGKVFMLSSRQYPDDFVEKKIQELRKDPHTLICEYSYYEMKRGDFAKEEFQVQIGNDRHASRIIYPNDIPNPECDIISVPMDFLKDFETDLEGSIRDISGRATLALSTFLKQRDKLYYCIKDYPQIFSVTSTTFEGDDHLLLDVIAGIDKTQPRCLHLDLSENDDATGLCMSHVCDLLEVTVKKQEEDEFGIVTMRTIKEMRPKYRVDLMLQIKAPVNGTIRYSKIRELIYTLRELGYEIQLITADKYQSTDMLQILEDNGFTTANLSVDRSMEPYNNLRDSIYEDRFEAYDHPVFLDEIIHLEIDTKKRKIDHRIGKCFTGDTVIKMLDGKNITFEELSKSERKDFWIYSAKEDGSIVPALANNCRITDHVTDLVEVTLDNNEIIKCTPNHPFMLRNGSYKYAKDLTIVDSLMPIYTQYFKNNSDKKQKTSGYERIFNNATQKWEFTHAAVARHLGFGVDHKSNVIHHYDFNKRNNTPNNLKPMTKEEHGRLHALLSKFATQPEVLKRRIETFKQRYWGDPERQKQKKESMKNSEAFQLRIKEGLKNLHSSDSLKKSYETRKANGFKVSTTENHLIANRTQEHRDCSTIQANKMNNGYWKTEAGKQKRQELSKTQLKDALQIRIDNEDKICKERIGQTLQYLVSYRQAMKLYGGGYATWVRRFELYNIDIKQNLLSIAKDVQEQKITLESIGLTSVTYNKIKRGIFVKSVFFNHKITSIKHIHYDTSIPVYDIEVPIYNNFALQAGVFVHNSKDVSDCVAGSVQGLLSLDIVTIGVPELTSKGILLEPVRKPQNEDDCIEDFTREFINESFLAQDVDSSGKVIDSEINNFRKLLRG